MRCDNCGWSNPEGLTKCQKCNQELIPAPVSSSSAPANQGAFNQTIIDQTKVHSVSQDQQAVACPRCGYPLSSSNTFCPNCGTQVSVENPSEHVEYAKTVRILPEEFLETESPEIVEEHLKKTVREIPADLMNATQNSQTVRVLPEEMLCDEEDVQPKEPSFRLILMDNFDGATPLAKKFEGADTIINGEALVSEGSYVPEGLEVEFTYADDMWALTDKTVEKAVYVSAANGVNVKSGDIIVIGNRRYIFE